jgi:hypothetical protein
MFIYLYMYHFEIHTVLYIVYVLGTYFTRSKKQESEAIVIRPLLYMCYSFAMFMSPTKLMRILSNCRTLPLHCPASVTVYKHINFFL